MKVSIVLTVLGVLICSPALAAETSKSMPKIVKCEWRDFKGKLDVVEASCGKEGPLQLCSGLADCVVKNADETTFEVIRNLSCPIENGKCPLATDCARSRRVKLGVADTGIELAPLQTKENREAIDKKALDATAKALKQFNCQQSPEVPECKEIADHLALVQRYRSEGTQKNSGMTLAQCKWVDPVKASKVVNRATTIDYSAACGGDKKQILCSGAVQCEAVLPEVLTLAGKHQRILFTTRTVCPSSGSQGCPSALSCALDGQVKMDMAEIQQRLPAAVSPEKSSLTKGAGFAP